MGTTALGQLLKSFCTNLPWSYSVLWKLSHDGQMILSWEDGYCDHPKPLKVMSEDIYCTGDASDLFSSCWEICVQDDDSIGYSIELAVASMSNLQYTLGEGVVGKVANTGNHFWAFYDNFSTSKVNSNSVPECPEEWLLQLAVGIKTIMLVPVLPHGVLQLGSLEVVAEDLKVVACIKDRFTFHGAGGNTLPLNLSRDVGTLSSLTLLPNIMKNLDEASASTSSPPKSEDLDTVDSLKPSKIRLSTMDQVVPLLTFQDELRVSREDLSGSFTSDCKNKTGNTMVGSNKESKSPAHSIYAGDLETLESKLFGLSCREDQLQAYSPYSKYDMEVLGELYSGAMDSFPAIDPLEQLLENEILNNTFHKSSTSFLSFPEDSELHEALGPTFQRHNNEYMWDLQFSADKTCSSSSLIYNGNLTDGIESTIFSKEGDAEYLLEAVVANAYCGSNDSSDVCNSVKSSVTSLGQFVASLQPQSLYETRALVGDGSVPQSHFTSTCIVGGRNEFTPTSTSIERTMGTFIDKEQVDKGYSYKEPKLSTVNKKRAKPGDNQRPRPRDRQLIQDRLRELRDLVPNGVKCSIDCLLDRTIKHMLYLRSITEQAEKLRQWAYHEMGNRKDLRRSEARDGNGNGTTWAFELGNDLLVCPIVVEDLACPGHILIEMLCNEHGLFFEIAQVIRSSQLTILKGVMENHSNNTWAHFIVEASKGFHRTDIFWPLMQLLQRKRNPISSKI